MPVTLKSKIGVHAESTPIKALLPRDLHIGNTDFEDIQEKEVVEFEVVGARFQQGDESIVVLGKLRSLVKTAAPSSSGEPSEEPDLQVIAAAVNGMGTGQDEKRVVTVDNVGAVKAAETGPRRRRIRANVAEEPKKE
jgi:hypothetical protein